jgi:succinate-acetate transporter protein
MSFHKKALITFVIFHLVFTLGGLLADSLQTHPDPTNDQAFIAQGVGLYVWVLFTLLVSLVGLAVAYSFRAIARFFGRLRRSEQI